MIVHKLDDLLKHSGIGEDTLQHWGVKGMKWKNRKDTELTAGGEEAEKIAEELGLSEKDKKELGELIDKKKLSPEKAREIAKFTLAVRGGKKASKFEMSIAIAEAKSHNKNQFSKHAQMKNDDRIRKGAKAAAEKYKQGKIESKLKTKAKDVKPKSSNSGEKKTAKDWSGTTLVSGSKEEKEFFKWAKDNGFKTTNLVDESKKNNKNKNTKTTMTTTDVTINGKPVKSSGSSKKMIDDFKKRGK